MIAYLEDRDTTVEVPDDISEKDLTDLNDNFESYFPQKEEKPANTYKPNFYESHIKPFVDTAAKMGPTSFATEAAKTPGGRSFAAGAVESFSFGLAKPLIEPTFGKEMADHPISTTLGKTAGDLGSLLATGGLLRLTKLPGYAAKAGQALTTLGEEGSLVAKIAAKAPRFIPPAIMQGATFGTKRFITEAVRSAQDQKLDVVDFGENVIKDTALGTFAGGISGLENAGTAIASAAGLGYLSARMEGADHAEAALNGAVWGAFEVAGSFGRDMNLRRGSIETLMDSAGEYIHARNPEMTPEQARNFGRAFVHNEAAKVGGIEKIIQEGPEGTLQFIEGLNQKIRNSLVVEPKPAPEAAKPPQIEKLGGEPAETIKPTEAAPEAPIEASGVPEAVKPKVKPIKYDNQGIPVLKPRSVVIQADIPGTGKYTVTHQMILEDAKAIHEQNLRQWESAQNNTDPIVQFVRKKRISKSPDLDWESIPLNLQDNKKGWNPNRIIEAINESPAEFGLPEGTEYTIDDLSKVVQMQNKEAKPTMADAYEEAKRGFEEHINELQMAGEMPDWVTGKEEPIEPGEYTAEESRARFGASDLEDRAIENFGFTDNSRRSGYILSNGKALDMSPESGESVEHYQIYDVYNEQEKAEIDKDKEGIDEREYFMEKTGAIRFAHDRDEFMIMSNGVPSDEQLKRIADMMLSEKPKKLFLEDISRDVGSNRYKEIPDNPTPEDLYRFFKGTSQAAEPSVESPYQMHLAAPEGWPLEGIMAPKKLKPFEATNQYKPSDYKPMHETHIETVFKNLRTVSIPNQKIYEPADLAFVFKQLRNPGAENFYLMAMKNDKIVAMEHLGMGTIDQVAVYPANILHLMDMTGADSIAISHNHPSGHVLPSDEDKRLTRSIQQIAKDHGVKFFGHVIVDDTTFGFIDHVGNITEEMHKEYDKTKNIDVLQKYFQWKKGYKTPTQKQLLTSPDRVFEVVKGIQVGPGESVIYLMNTQNEVMNSVIVPKGNINIRMFHDISAKFRPAGIITVNSDLSDQSVRNLKASLTALDIRWLDDVAVRENPFSYVSRLERGMMESRQAYGAKEEGALFQEEEENVGDRYTRLRQQAISQGMNPVQAGKWAKQNLMKAEYRPAEAKPQQTEMGAPGGVEGFGRGRKGEGELFTVGSAKIDSFEEIETPEEQKARKEFKLSDEARRIIEKYANRVGERYLPRGAAGVFYPGTTNIRVNALNNLSTVAHEVTHYIDQSLGVVDPLIRPIGTSKAGNPIYDPKYRDLRKRLTELYVEYYPGGKADHRLRVRMREGIATFFQKFVENPSAIREKYPDLVKEFLNEGGVMYREEWPEFVEDLNKVIAGYQALDPLEKIGARMTSKFQQAEVKDSFLNFTDKLRQEVIDDVYPLEKLAIKAGKERTALDPSLWARQYKNITAVILQNIRGKKGLWTYGNGQFNKVLDENIRDLTEKLQHKGLTDDFGKWLLARDTYFNYHRLDILKEQAQAAAKALQEIREAAKEGEIPLKADIAMLQKQIEDYKNLRDILHNEGLSRDVVTQAYHRNIDTFQPFVSLYDSINRENVKMLADPDIGLITPEQETELLSREGYASRKRDIYDEILGGEEPIRKGTAKTKVGSMLGRKGSELTILNPLYSQIIDHAEIMKKGIKQLVYNRLAALAKDFPDLFQQTQLKPHVDPESGAITYPQERDPNILMARLNGKRVPYLISKELKGIVDELLDFQNIHIFEKWARTAARIFSKGTTGSYPLFAPVNFLVDQITASANTRNKYVPVIDGLKSIMKSLFNHGSKEAKYFEEYLALGGERQTFVRWQDKQPDELFPILLNERKGLEHIADFIEKGYNILSMPAGVSEIMTRAGEYVKSRMNGNPQVVALEDAGRVSAPFHHLGRFGGSKVSAGGKLTVGQTFIKSIPFFNPGIQVLDQYYKSVKQGDTRSRALLVTLAVMASMVASSVYIMKKATKEQKDAYKDLEPNELSMYVFMPSPNGKDLIRLRVPNEMGFLANMINMGLWEMMTDADYKIGDYASAATSWLPGPFDVSDPRRMFLSVMPQLIKPLMGVIYNKKEWPALRPLVSQGLENLEPRFQFNDNTSKFAKYLGDKFNLSPIKIDYLIEGYLGRLSKFATGKPLGKEMSKTFIREWYFTAGRNLQDYYEERTKVDQLYRSLTGRMRKFSPEESRKISILKSRSNVIDSLLETYRDIDRMTKDKTQQSASMDRLRENILNQVSLFRNEVRK